MSAPTGNKFAVGLETSGRPPVYDSPDSLVAKINEYLEWAKGESHTETKTRMVRDRESGEKIPEEYEAEVWDREPERLTVTGMALFLGFSSRQSMYDYAKKDEYSYIVKRAIMVIENGYEIMLSEGSPTGAIFALKNMGWKDSVAVDHTTNGKDINGDFSKLTDAELDAIIAEEEGED